MGVEADVDRFRQTWPHRVSSSRIFCYNITSFYGKNRNPSIHKIGEPHMKLISWNAVTCGQGKKILWRRSPPWTRTSSACRRPSSSTTPGRSTWTCRGTISFGTAQRRDKALAWLFLPRSSCLQTYGWGKTRSTTTRGGVITAEFEGLLSRLRHTPTPRMACG